VSRALVAGIISRSIHSLGLEMSKLSAQQERQLAEARKKLGED
jgi:hypothetical protein